MKQILALILAGGLSFAPFLHDTNSRASARRAMQAFAKRDYPGAVAGFRTADAIHATPLRDFNLGTSQIAAGSREEGSTTIGRAMRDLTLREPALFNRGNAALEAKAFDYAIRDYIAALRLQASDAAAKRNLEIALQRKAQQDKQQQNGAGGTKPNPGPQAPQPPSQSPQNGQPQPKGNADLDALLRSVQQQEQEELARMRAQRAVQGHVGW
jgi:tetratricopeptide (TPR) repeat protein